MWPRGVGAVLAGRAGALMDGRQWEHNSLVPLSGDRMERWLP